MSVLVAYLHPGSVSHSFADSLQRLVAYDLAHHQHVVSGGGPMMMRCGSGGLVEARNKVAAAFLAGDDDWLFMIDADMGFAPDTVDRLLAAADPGDRPVMGALCFGLREIAEDGMQGFTVRGFPTVFDWNRDTHGRVGFRVRRDYPPDTVTRVAATGAACLLVHRSAVQAVADESGTWFDPMCFDDGRSLSEDLSFCARLAKADLPVYIHTGVKTTHHKPLHFGEREYRLLEAGFGKDDQ